MKDKNFEPEIVSENPFPGEVVQPVLSQAQAVGEGNYAPTATKEKTFPKKRIAVELLSTALNTRSRKILEEFDLQQSGGFQVGDFKKGISGDLRITPNGLTARDIAGITTLAIDGTTGDAVFKGEVRAGSLVSDAEIEGGSININDKFTVDAEGNVVVTKGNITVKDDTETTIIDATGLVSTANFAADSISQTASFSTTNQSFVDVTDMTLSFTLARSSKVLIGASVRGYSPDSSPTNIVTPISIIDLDGSQVAGEMSTPSIEETAGKYFTTSSTTIVSTIASGSHTIKIQLKSSSGGNVTLGGSRVLWYVVLGK